MSLTFENIVAVENTPEIAPGYFPFTGDPRSLHLKRFFFEAKVQEGKALLAPVKYLRLLFIDRYENKPAIEEFAAKFLVDNAGESVYLFTEIDRPAVEVHFFRFTAIEHRTRRE